MNEKKGFKLNKFTKVIIGEIILLAVMVLVCRMWIFPVISGINMYHIQVATHAVMIGICMVIFSVMAILAKRKWKTHKKYVLLPVIFTVFAYILYVVAGEISVI